MMRALGRSLGGAARAAATMTRAEHSVMLQSARSVHITSRETVARAAKTFAATTGPELRTATQMALAQARRCMSSAAEAQKELTGFAKLSAKSAMYPTVTGVVVTLVRTAPCDIFSQLYIEQKKEIDWGRFAGFMIFGGLYVGVFQTFLYRYIINAANITAITGLTGKAPIVVINALIDTFIHAPFLYLPVFWLTMKAMASGDPVETWIPDTFTKWKAQCFDVSVASAVLWLPAQIVNFYFMPQHLIVPFINVVGAFWVVYLSLNEGKDLKKSEEEEKTA